MKSEIKEILNQLQDHEEIEKINTFLSIMTDMGLKDEHTLSGLLYYGLRFNVLDFEKIKASYPENIVNIVSRENFGQIFITDTNRENLDRILEKSGGDYKIFKVENGKFEEEKLSSLN